MALVGPWLLVQGAACGARSGVLEEVPLLEGGAAPTIEAGLPAAGMDASAGTNIPDASEGDASSPSSDATLPDAQEVDTGVPDTNPLSPPGPPAPRPVAPLSTATVTSQKPLLRWALPTGVDGAAVDVCRDRACTVLVATVLATGSSIVLPDPLIEGVYFWQLRGIQGGVLGTAKSPVWEMFVGARSAPQNTSWGTTLDVNGDGYADVMVGAPNTAGTNESAYLYLGNPLGVSTLPTPFTYPDHPSGNYRDPIASAGDIDGDGFADVVIGAPDPNAKSGQVLLFRGGAQGLSAPATLPAPAGVDGSFGWSVAGAGDVNGDGYADVIVGAPYTQMYEGEAFLYYGGPSGLSATPVLLTVSGLPAGTYAYYGYAVSGAGDVNGDGFADVVVGSLLGRQAYVYLGGVAGLSATPEALTDLDPPGQPDENPDFGSTVACAGDVNGDGFADVLVGAPINGDDYEEVGSVYLYLGGPGGLTAPAIALANASGNTGGEFGIEVAGAGDVDGDGFADILAATETDSYLYFGGPGGPSALPVRFDIPGGESNSYGAAFAAAGDVDGDGYDDVVIGSPWSNNWIGGAFLYRGGPMGPGSAFALHGPSTANGIFGNTVASRLRGRRRRR